VVVDEEQFAGLVAERAAAPHRDCSGLSGTSARRSGPPPSPNPVTVAEGDRTRLPTAAEVPIRSDELDRSGRFGPVVFRRHQWELLYSAAAYVELLRTYSGHIAMAPDAREGLFAT
jgi:hypothetical protein